MQEREAPMPIEAVNWLTIDETCEARTQRRISRDLSEFEIRSLREQLDLTNSIIRTNLGIHLLMSSFDTS
jgi:hypothetical protein